MEEYSNLFVCLMGLGTVFFGLICLIVLTEIMGRLIGGRAASAAGIVRGADGPTAVYGAANPAPAAPEANRMELAAAVSAAVAEELGTDVTGIRIVSMRKLEK